MNVLKTRWKDKDYRKYISFANSDLTNKTNRLLLNFKIKGTSHVHIKNTSHSNTFIFTEEWMVCPKSNDGNCCLFSFFCHILSLNNCWDPPHVTEVYHCIANGAGVPVDYTYNNTLGNSYRIKVAFIVLKKARQKKWTVPIKTNPKVIELRQLKKTSIEMSSLYVQAFKYEKTSQELQTSPWQNLQFKEHVLYLL